MDTERKIGNVVVLNHKKYIITNIDEKGNYTLKTPAEIKREQNAKIKIGDELILSGIPHYITEIVNDKAILKTYKEIYDESCCKVCKFFNKDKGYELGKRVKESDKEKNVFGCRLGQISQTTNILNLRKECKFKNYIYKPREEVKKGIERLVNACTIKCDNLGKIMYPIDRYCVLGLEVIDVEREKVSLVRLESIKKDRWGD
jgi:hypothetical protein